MVCEEKDMNCYEREKGIAPEIAATLCHTRGSIRKQSIIVIFVFLNLSFKWIQEYFSFDFIFIFFIY